MAKILVVGNPYMNYTSALVRGLSELGHEVFFHKHNISLFERIKFSFKALVKVLLNGGEFSNTRVSKFEDTVVKYDFDIFIYFNGKMKFDYVNDYIYDLLKSKNTRMIVWYMDSIKYCNNSNKNLGYFDEIFSFERSDCDYYKRVDIQVKYLPIGVDSEIYCSNINQCSAFDNKEYDLCFVGTCTPNRLLVLEEVAKYAYKNSLKMVVYGRWWNKRHLWNNFFARRQFAKNYPYLYKYVKNESIKPTELASLYLNSKICLNIHTSIHEGCNPRTFEILGNGNFELCDFRDDFKEFGLIDGVHFAIYNNVDECIEKIDYYLKNDVERNLIGNNGREIVMEKYTMKEIVRKGMNL